MKLTQNFVYLVQKDYTIFKKIQIHANNVLEMEFVMDFIK